LSAATLEEARRSGGPRGGRMRGPHYIRLGRAVRYRRDDLVRWLLAREGRTPPAHELVEQFLARSPSVGRTARRHLGAMRATLDHLLHYLREQMLTLADLGRADLEAFLAREDARLRTSKRARALAHDTVRAFIAWSLAEGHLSADPNPRNEAGLEPKAAGPTRAGVAADVGPR